MNVFDELQANGKTLGIDLILRRLTEDEYSHVLSWPMPQVNQLKHVGIKAETIHQSIKEEADYDAWKDYEYIAIYHDMAAFPTRNIVNVYDIGVEKSAWFFERLTWDKHKHIKFISLDYPMIPYGSRCAYKAPRPATSQYWKGVDWKKVQDRCDGITDWILDPGVRDGKYLHTHLTIGDSHAHSVYRPGSIVLRKDARHLRGVLKKTMLREIAEQGYDETQFKSFTCYWGSIDIRHHLCREPDHAAATNELLRDYEEGLKVMSKGRPVELVVPLPIEDESRVIPHMGWYKGAPFCGSQAERKVVRDRFEDGQREMAARNGWTIFKWPQEWYDMDGVDFMRTYLERPRSVHCAWKYYRWDLVKDEPNQRLVSGSPSSLLQF